MKETVKKIQKPTLYVITEPRYSPEATIDDILDRKYSTDPCVKIGYTVDLKSRLPIYNTDSPGFKILFIIEDPTITKIDESRLHNYFQKYREGKNLNGKEWFIFDKEIYNFFNTYKTIQEIRNVIPEIIISDKQLIRLRNNINPILDIMIKKGIGFEETDKIPSITELQVKYVTNTQYFETCEEFIDFLKDELSNDEINIILDEFNKLKPAFDELIKFKAISKFPERLKYIFELEKTMDKDNFSLFLDSIPIEYKNYYTILGEEKCSGFSFRRSELEKEYQKLMNNQNIDPSSEVYKAFKIGEKYTKAYIKEKLGEIYNTIGYQKTPAALDLYNYFNCKEGLYNDPITKKRSASLEIISKK